MDKIGICFGVLRGNPIDPVFCSRDKNGMWFCWEVKKLENQTAKANGIQRMKTVSPVGNTCDFFLYEFEEFVLLRYPRQLICEETAFSEISRLFGKREEESARREYDKVREYEDLGHVGLHGDGWMLFKGKRFFGIVVNKNTPAWESPTLQEELKRARENKDVP